MVGSVVYSVLLQKTYAYKTLTIVICFLSTSLFILLRLVVDFMSFGVYICIGGFLGFNLVAVAPILCDLGVEQLYPLGVSYSPTFLSMSSSIGTFILTCVCSFLLHLADYPVTNNKSGGYEVLDIMPFCTGIALFLNFTFKVELKRTKALKKDKFVQEIRKKSGSFSL